MRPTRGTPDNLNSITELDVPFTVHADGMITDAPRNVHTPDVHGFDGHAEIEADGWEFASYGYSGQHGTTMRDPELHDSEFLGGGLARDILATPGTYVCVPIFWPTVEDDPDASEEEREDGGSWEGWVVLRRTDT